MTTFLQSVHCAVCRHFWRALWCAQGQGGVQTTPTQACRFPARMIGRCQRFTGVNHSRNVTSFHDIVLGSYIYWHNMALLIMHLHLLQAAECDSSSLPSQCHLDILPSQACCSQYQWPGHATGCSYVTMIYGQVYVFDALLIEDIHDKKHPCISINLWSYPPSFT